MQKPFVKEPLHFLCRICMSKLNNRKHLGWSKVNMKMSCTTTFLPIKHPRDVQVNLKKI